MNNYFVNTKTDYSDPMLCTILPTESENNGKLKHVSLKYKLWKLENFEDSTIKMSYNPERLKDNTLLITFIDDPPADFKRIYYEGEEFDGQPIKWNPLEKIVKSLSIKDAITLIVQSTYGSLTGIIFDFHPYPKLGVNYHIKISFKKKVFILLLEQMPYYPHIMIKMWKQ